MHARLATLDDTESLSRLAIESFVAKFGALYSLQDLKTYLQLAYSLDAIERSLLDPAQKTWLLVDDNGALQAYSLIGPASLPHAEIRPGDGEIKRFYVTPSSVGSGLGAALMQVVMDDLLKDDPQRTLWLGVYSDNPGAQRFYERYGFTRVGEYQFPVGETRDREFIFRRQPARS